ncbi:MAG: YaaR family protein [Treponema sp.]|nr:YaaR family protein [Treponema sp.]MBQ6567988.1 YaaR family protein [Treponema sp.]MBQ7167764.1 YaaR family protein [Treponema sp.]
MDMDSLSGGVSNSTGLYFAGLQGAQEKLRSKKKEEVRKASRSSFVTALQRSHEERELEEAGLPKEIVGMDSADAVIFLKDAADIAADKLKGRQTPENFADYRKKVTQFMRYIVKYNFKRVQKKHFRSNPKRHLKLNDYVQIQVVNQKLDEMARWLISSHRDTLVMLARIEEISGLLVDLMAT